MNEAKKLTFTGALECEQKDHYLDIRDLSGQIEKLEKAFPDFYTKLDGYQEAVGGKEWCEELIDVENKMIPVLKRLDEFLEKVMERIELTPIGYGYDLVRSGGNIPKYMSNIWKWNYERTHIGRELYMIEMEQSVFPTNGLYFAFPKYSGAILYMTADICRYSDTESYVQLTMGMQVVDDFDAFSRPCLHRKDYATIPLVTFSRHYKDGLDEMNRLPYNGNQAYYDELTYLNRGYCEGIYQIVCDVLKDGYLDIFRKDEVD